MHDFIPGQRCISEAELQMGLGTVLAVEHRTVTVLFLATGETRTYARQSAPLTRVAFSAGDTVLSHDGRGFNVESVVATHGLLTYIGTDEDGNTVKLEEGQLNNFIRLSRPTERLFSGQIDRDKLFEVRYQTLQQLHRLYHSDLYGLSGCRTSLIPHQLYIAHEVANRYAPRVLLADEVGLGKTIEAGLILHHQLLTERARRALIVVPESLVHQWLVEMLRRFNLHFSIFDQQRCLAIEESTDLENPFHSEQLILCNLEFLVSHPRRFQQCLAGDWDLLVVDEAHHLNWSPQQVSPEYALIEQLAEKTKGVLLLTATPEQLGKASHFARLRLLDPDRFPDFDSFIREENGYQPIAQAVEDLLNARTLSESDRRILLDTIDEGDNQRWIDILQSGDGDTPESGSAREELVQHLLDRHGTGRVLFRNTRAAVKGFPARTVTGHPLALPSDYVQSLEAAQERGISDTRYLLSPERLYQENAGPVATQWTRFDPRIRWLGDFMVQLKPRKVLVITATPQTAIDIVESLRIEAGIHAAVFHEGLSIVERDRAAAFFADQQSGSQVLVCSEIGSEGRNFQFAHHMVLFDLPLNPDLLEQRIGRLDRIGQTQSIKLHVPYLEHSAQAVMFHWYHEGLSAFEQTCPAGHSVFVQVQSTLLEALHQAANGARIPQDLIATTRSLHRESSEALQRGRDRLLEYNSCRPRIADTLKQRALEQDDTTCLPDYMDSLYDCFGIDTEPHSEACYIIRPSEHVLTPLPGLPEDGMRITYNREIALANEDMHYISWEHPLVCAAMDLVLGSEMGNTAVTAVEYRGVKPGTLLLECLYILESASSEQLQSRRYLPPTIIRVLIDEQGNDHHATLAHSVIGRTRASVDTETANKIIRAKHQDLRELVASGERAAQAQAPGVVAGAHRQSRQILEKEINRLRALSRINRNIRAAEIDYFEDQLSALGQALEAASLRLDALRVIVAT